MNGPSTCLRELLTIAIGSAANRESTVHGIH